MIKISILYCLALFVCCMSGCGALDKKQSILYQVDDNCIEMIRVQGGTFMMGMDAQGESGHSVILNDYYIGKYEVTVAQFHSFIAETNYQTDAEKDGGCEVVVEGKRILRADVNWRCDNRGIQRSRQTWDHPVIFVSWNDANAFCNWLSAKTGRQFQLPTEAQWEFAARGGDKSQGYIYSGSNHIDSVAWFGYYDLDRRVGNSDFETHPVGKKQPNELGIHDMSGNVWEWCADLEQTDSCRIIRGGCWDNYARRCLVVNRMGDIPKGRNSGVGFRVAETK